MPEMDNTWLKRGDGEERWKPPYVPWFEGDFSGSYNVRKMARLARLMYRSLLQQGWHSDNPPYIPNREADLLLMADAPSAEEWALHQESILARFKQTPDGLWLFHPKAVREYDRACSEHDRKVAAGSKRWGGRAQLEPSYSSAQAEHQRIDVASLSSHPTPPHNQSRPTEEKPCCTPSKTDAASQQSALITLPLNDRSEYPIVPLDASNWQALFPAVDVMQELRSMRAWCLANPKSHKTRSGILRFVNGWLQKAQNRAPVPFNGMSKKPTNGLHSRDIDYTKGADLVYDNNS